MGTSFLAWETQAIACLAQSNSSKLTIPEKSVIHGIMVNGICDRLFPAVMKLLPSQFSWLNRWLVLPILWTTLLWLLNSAPVSAGALAERLAAFPQWNDKPPVEAAQGDLVYPSWLAGSWNMSSTLVEMVAPLAPDVMTPGFEGNRQFLNKPVQCQVRFVASSALGASGSPLPFLSLPTKSLVNAQIVSDRAFNGLNLSKAYLGDRVFRVWVDPRDSNRMITKFRDNRKLFSTTIGRAVEQPDAAHFIASEFFQQFFQLPEKPYKNQVETTTEYVLNPDGTVSADQMTAVYLNPPHPKAFLAGDRPVALYRYRLEFSH